jgi:hypothetical protein
MLEVENARTNALVLKSPKQLSLLQGVEDQPPETKSKVIISLERLRALIGKTPSELVSMAKEIYDTNHEFETGVIRFNPMGGDKLRHDRAKSALERTAAEGQTDWVFTTGEILFPWLD